MDCQVVLRNDELSKESVVHSCSSFESKFTISFDFPSAPSYSLNVFQANTSTIAKAGILDALPVFIPLVSSII